ncbi:MAG: hypothetical protein IJ608_12230 [Lachnospiraceae bacterium]|nr:hypothetical protein [Lachnospiraceae bacterium]
MDKDTGNLINRLKELSNKSDMQGVYTFTPFLNLSEQSVFHSMEKELSYAGYSVYGGYDDSERNIIRFGNEEAFGYLTDFPIKCIRISPLQPKFADELNHRDFLGSLMNLGIDRGTLGDIIVKEKEAYLFCLDSIGDYIIDNLVKVKHTNVKCEYAEGTFEALKKELKEVRITANSVRLDGLISKVYNISRNECIELFREGRVFVNSRLCESNAKALKGGEVINVRGFGKFIFDGEAGETRKGKLACSIRIYE